MHRGRHRVAVIGRNLAAATVGAGLLWWAMPRVSGVSWGVLGTALTAVTARELVALAGVWALGLLAHSFVLTGALPGLSCRRALTLNLTGSAISNVAPFGGAIAVATNLRMTRTWHFKRTAFAAYAVVTNIWDVVAKLVLPLVALAALLATGSLTSHALRSSAWVASAGLVVVLAGTAVALLSDRVARAVARSSARVVHRLFPRRLPAPEVLSDSVLETRRRAQELIARGWFQLTAGMGAYVALQGALLWMCLHVAGATLPPYAVLAGFAVERLLTLAVITPGGTGIAEGGVAATLVAFGGPPVAVAVGVLLYRGFIVLLEIPVGGIWLGGWLLTRERGKGLRV